MDSSDRILNISYDLIVNNGISANNFTQNAHVLILFSKDI